jgi:hypothetical protein
MTSPSEDVSELVRRLRDASDGWSGDAACIAAEIGEQAALALEALQTMTKAQGQEIATTREEHEDLAQALGINEDESLLDALRTQLQSARSTALVELREIRHRLHESRILHYDDASILLASYDALIAASSWQPIETAPKDGTTIDLWLGNHRVADAWWGRPEHSCGEMGRHCDNHPSYDGWCDVFGYVTGPDGHESGEPSHWQPLPAPPKEQTP